MDLKTIHSCTAFEGAFCLASGPLPEVVRQVKEKIDSFGQADVLIFDDVTSELVEVDFRGSPQAVLGRIEEQQSATSGADGGQDEGAITQRGPGRPRMGVVSREVTLLPRHWDWLNSQPGGASVTLRKLVEKAKRDNHEQDVIRLAREATYRFMSAMAGDLPGYEEAIRALFGGNRECFRELTDSWPEDIKNHIRKISGSAFAPSAIIQDSGA